MNKYRYRQTHFFSKQQGTSIVELALILPVLVMLVFGFVELGRGLLQTNMLTKQVETGARFLARFPEAVTEPPHCADGAEWGNATTQARALVTNSNGGTGGIILPGLDDGAAVTFDNRPDFSGVSIVCVVRVEVQTDFQAIFGDSIVPLLNLGPINLNAVAEDPYIGD